MRKLSILAATIAVFGMTFTGCKEDTQPRLSQPTKFVLNTPAMAENTYELSPTSTVDLTCSQADYGAGIAYIYYTVDISFSDKFETPYDKSTGTGDYVTLDGNYTNTVISIPGEDFAIGMCTLLGYEEEDQFVDQIYPVYVRVKSSIPTWTTTMGTADEGSPVGDIYSNTILLKAVHPYFQVRLPAKIYLVGQPQGWDISSPAMPLSEPDNGVGSNVYSATYEISADDAASGFRFYTELGSWGDDGQLPSIGANANDGDNMSVKIDEDGVYTGKCVNGKGNWNITNWPGGMMKLTVDLNGMTVIFEKAE